MIRPWLAVVGFFAVGFVAVLVGGIVARSVQPGSQLDRHDRIPPTVRRVTGWARSRSLRLWCPVPELAEQIVLLLATPQGVRLRRLGVSIVDDARVADVIVLRDAHTVEALRSTAPTPCASIVVEDVTDLADSLIALAAALRWGESA